MLEPNEFVELSDMNTLNCKIKWVPSFGQFLAQLRGSITTVLDYITPDIWEAVSPSQQI